MRALINTALLAGLFLIQACHHKDEMGGGLSTDPVTFAASLSDKMAIATRGLNDEKGEIVALPYINGIHVRKADQTTAVYKVKNGYKGMLEHTDHTPIQWEADLNTPVEFYGWTAPTGVVVDEAGDGTVDFNFGNTYLEAEVNKVNDAYVTPLEVFVGTPVISSTREASPSVSLPFNHLVSKLSIRVRDWNNQEVNDNATISFLGIKNIWSVGKEDANGIQIKKDPVVGGVVDFLQLDCSSRIYLPPLTKALGTDFKTAGDFCVELNGNTYFGTLDNVGQNITELHAGQHLHVTMDLSENFGVGVGTRIVDWKFGEADVIEGNPYNGIYTYDDLKRVATAVNAGTAVPPLLIDNGTIRLYRNIQLGADWESINISSTTSLIFDGNGYTISGLNAGAGLFGSVDGATIKNLTLSGCVVTAERVRGAGLLIGNAINTTIENCRVIGACSVTNTEGAAGGLIGTTGAGVAITNCSVEMSGTIAGNIAGALVGQAAGVSIAHCFAVFADENMVGLLGSGSSTISYSYFWNTLDGGITGHFWGNATIGTITFDHYGSTVDIAGSESSLLDALQVGDKSWVYVYDKGYPVLKGS